MGAPTAGGVARRVFPRNIGFRGNHAHGRPLGDPVFPTKAVAWDLKPKPLVDWRSAGRALLMAALARLEGFRLRSQTTIMRLKKNFLKKIFG